MANSPRPPNVSGFSCEAERSEVSSAAGRCWAARNNLQDSTAAKAWRLRSVEPEPPAITDRPRQPRARRRQPPAPRTTRPASEDLTAGRTPGRARHAERRLQQGYWSLRRPTRRATASNNPARRKGDKPSSRRGTIIFASAAIERRLQSGISSITARTSHRRLACYNLHRQPRPRAKHRSPRLRTRRRH